MLSLDDARDLPFADLMEAAEKILQQYDPPQDLEPHADKLARLNATIEEVPQHYRWFLQLQSWCDHWAQSFSTQFGQKDERYQRMRQRRDLFDRMASAAKMRYEAASRRITTDMGYDTTGMPRRRN